MDTSEWLVWAFHVVADFFSRLSQITLFIKQYKGHDIWTLLIQRSGVYVTASRVPGTEINTVLSPWRLTVWFSSHDTT